MIPVWKKQLILDRLKYENQGALDYLTPDDVIIKPFGAKCQLNKMSSKLGVYTASMINTRYFGGRFKTGFNETAIVHSFFGSTYNHYQKYRIIGKPERFVIGEFIIAVYIDEPNSYIRKQNDYWTKTSKPTQGYFKDALVYSNTLFMDTTVLKGREIDQLRREEIISLLPGCIRIDMNDVDQITVEKLRRNDTVSTDRNMKHNHVFDYVKVTISLKMTDDETSFYLNQNPTPASPNAFTFFIINKNAYANAKELYYGGNTSNLRLTLGEDDINMSGCDPVKENGNFSTLSLVLEHNDCPKYATMQYDYYYEFNPQRNNEVTPIKINEFSSEIQKIIIDTLSRFHHWRWGTQNQPNKYSEVPSTHNLNNARIRVVNRTPTKYKDARTGRINVSFGERPLNVFIKNVTQNNNPDEETEVYLSVAIIPDEQYNTGYDGQLLILICAKVFKFDLGIS